MVDFKAALEPARIDSEWAAISNLKKEVITFARRFPTVGFEEASMKYK